ncbi:MAG: hypothetical protein AVDCRST_MAG89-5041 [uncultured Gemmatimonadetes bacterium]|uniref:Glycosyl transferase family 1 domain-containing protein n=1 Tax=uncultured Gemmatimonadota bacterium TaxID=203437 RepID=A0A6J4N4M7_9BACT|nr:MAG: hypothetical protein AVDCRST_MAG89-5041 [uncultured Gemmatimonadota bacterium]
MRIAVVSTMGATPWGGSEELWALMAGHALDDGHEVALFVHRWPELHPALRALSERGARLYRRGRSYALAGERMAGRVLRRPVRLSPPPVLSSFRHLYAWRPDVVVISEGTFFSFVHVGEVADWLAESGTPYVPLVQYLSDAYGVADAFRERAARFYGQAARVAFVSAGNLESGQRQLAARLPNATVVQNPVKLVDAGPMPLPPAGPAQLASVGRLAVGDKGQDVLLQTLGGPAWRGREWRLNLYGTGGDEGYLRALAGMYGVADRVAFHGHVTDVPSIWAANHLLVMPSRAEGTPLALLEAMRCGRAAVVTDVGGNVEWVREGHTGFVAEAPTARSFGAALERAWAARAEWSALGRTAYDEAARRLDAEPGRTLLNMVTGAARAESD